MATGHTRGARAAVTAACAGAAGLLTWYGCSIYEPSLLLAGRDASADHFAGDAAADAPSDAIDAGPGPCPETFAPPPPDADDPSDAGDQSLLMALHTIDFGFDDDGGAAAATFGYDLDGVYTCCDGGPESCNAAVTGATHCDELGGRDNSAGQLLGSLASIDSTQFNTATINERLANGTYSILLQVLHYNGQANDTQVTAALYASDGIAHDAGAKWNGSDPWTVDDSFVIAPDAGVILPNHFDSNAYVSGGTLVVHLSFPLSLGRGSTGDFTITLTPGLLTGTLVPAGSGTYGLRAGQIAGRWNVSNLLGTVQALTIMSQTICPGSQTYAFVKQQVCQYADIMTDPSLDKTGATCDALSLGMGFTADPALFGKLVRTPVLPPLCPTDAGPDDCGP